MCRRQFVRPAATGGLAVMLSINAKHGIGLQLWTVRNQLSEDQSTTLKTIADAGYQQLELMNEVGSQSRIWGRGLARCI